MFTTLFYDQKLSTVSEKCGAFCELCEYRMVQRRRVRNHEAATMPEGALYGQERGVKNLSDSALTTFQHVLVHHR